MPEYIKREAVVDALNKLCDRVCQYSKAQRKVMCVACPLGDAFTVVEDDIPTADVRPVSEIEKIIESLQEQADIYNARAQELLVEEDGQVSQYTWAVSLRETYRRIIKALDDLIS